MVSESAPLRPLRELTTLRDVWDRVFGGWPSTEPILEGWTPSLDVSETKNDIIVKAEITGIHAKDIDVSLADGVLTLRGERKLRTEDIGENYHRMHGNNGAFARSIRLPHGGTN